MKYTPKDFIYPYLILATGVLLLASTSLSSASFALVENFNSLTLGDIDGQDGWTAPDNNYTVTNTAPATVSNQAMSNGTGVAYKDFSSIGTTGQGTLYFEMYLNDIAAGQSFGVTYGTGVDPLDYATQMSLNTSGVFRIRDGGTTYDADNSVTLEADEWYQFWMPVDNQNNTWSLYVQGGAIASQTQVTANGGNGTFGFRTSPDSVINRFLLSRGGTGTGTAVIDNVYVDSSGVNLASPIPEPAHSALVGMGFTCLSLMLYRRLGLGKAKTGNGL